MLYICNGLICTQQCGNKSLESVALSVGEEFAKCDSTKMCCSETHHHGSTAASVADGQIQGSGQRQII